MDPRSPCYREFLILTFREHELGEAKYKKRNRPDYTFVGDYFSVFLSLYFGKRFDNLGFLQAGDIHCIPDIQQPRPRKLVEAPPVSSRPRKDLGIPLDLGEAKSLLPILQAVFDEIDNKTMPSEHLERAYTAGRCYQRALQCLESDPELAYLSLVTAGEVLVDKLVFTDDDLYDPETQARLAAIKDKAGADQAHWVGKRLFQVTRKFCFGLSKLVNDAFFAGGESKDPNYMFQKGDFNSRMKAAYKVRCKFHHAGRGFGIWVKPLDNENADISGGTPCSKDNEWKAIITLAPTLIGLERVIRFCLLRFLHQHGFWLHSKLD
jgi:hypothetical protein